MAATIAVADRVSHAVDWTTTHNFTVDAPDDGYLLIGFVWYGGNGGGITLASITIDGGAATQHVYFHPGAQRHVCLIAGKAVLAGSIPVTLVLNDLTDWVLCEAALATGIDTTEIDEATSSSAGFPSGSDVTHTLDLDTVAGGVVFAMVGASVVGEPTSLGYAGITDFGADVDVGNGYGLGGYQQIASGETPRAVSAAWDIGTADVYTAVAAAVSFAPALAPATGRSWGAVMG
jgi:hypothetical protein